MNIVIEIYLIVSVLLLAFDIGFLLVKNVRKQELYPRNTDLEDSIREAIQVRRETGAFPEDFGEDLEKQLRKVRNFITLMDVLETEQDAEFWFRPAVFRQIEEYQKKGEYEQAYYAYAVSRFDYAREPVPPEFAAQFMTFLDSKSLYTFANAMDALYRFGETNLLLTAVEKVDQGQGFYHQRLLTDGLLASRANFQDLNPALLRNFDRYTPFMQLCLLNYFRMVGYDIHELCARLIRGGKNVDQEVRYGAMRYFTKYPTAQSRAFFLDVLRDEEAPWTEQMLAIQALEDRPDPEVRPALEKRVTSPSWYVRTRAISCLHRWGLTKEQIFDLLYLRDKYADDALLYEYRDEKEFSRYIIDTIVLLQEQNEAAAKAREMETAKEEAVV